MTSIGSNGAAGVDSQIQVQTREKSLPLRPPPSDPHVRRDANASSLSSARVAPPVDSAGQSQSRPDTCHISADGDGRGGDGDDDVGGGDDDVGGDDDGGGVRGVGRTDKTSHHAHEDGDSGGRRGARRRRPRSRERNHRSRWVIRDLLPIFGHLASNTSRLKF